MIHIAWIKSHQEIGRHPKTRRLKRCLNASLAATVGHLHLLWHWALDYAPDGELTQFAPEEIADAAGWEFDASDFIQAMIEAGFFDTFDNDSRLKIHDWHDYAGNLLAKRKANADRMRDSRNKPKPELRFVPGMDEYAEG